MSPEEKRIRERGDASDLVGTVDCRKPDGTPVPVYDENGQELLGVVPPDFGTGNGEQ
jgi:hypothetical protein